MKKTSLFLVVSALTVIFVFNPGCRKPKDPIKPHDPCATAVTVKAIDFTYDYCGQFEMTDRSNITYRLYAVNWSEYSDRIKPGREYQMAYKEVDCSCDSKFKWEDQMNCGCFGPQLKCIKITCLEERSCTTEPVGCLGSMINPDGFNDKFSHVLEGRGITGDQFKMKLGYSGCSRDELKGFKLALQETRFRCPEPKLDRIFLAKAVSSGSLLCAAYFEDEVCFDLSELRSYMMAEQYDMSQPVTLRIQYRDGTLHDFRYQP